MTRPCPFCGGSNSVYRRGKFEICPCVPADIDPPAGLEARIVATLSDEELRQNRAITSASPLSDRAPNNSGSRMLGGFLVASFVLGASAALLLIVLFA